LKLYQHQLDCDLFLLDGVFPANDFKNIITLGLQLEAFPWIRQFLEDYRQYLSPAQADNIYNYSLAQFYYTTKTYDKAVDLLREVQFTDRYYDINGSIMLLKIYLVQKDYFSFHYFLDACKIRMQRNREVAADYRKSIINFLKICKRIVDLQERSPYLSTAQYQRRHQKIEQQLTTVRPLFDQRWLQQELGEIARGN
jgi:tetratricopeptide (TPR) repeat protein